MNRVKRIVLTGVNSLSQLEYQLNDHLSLLLFGQKEVEDYKDLPLPSERREHKPIERKPRPRSRQRGQLHLLLSRGIKRSLLFLIEACESMFSRKEKELGNSFL